MELALETPTRFDFLLNYVYDLKPYLKDPHITEIMVNPVEGGGYLVFVERGGVMSQVSDVFLEHAGLMALASDIARHQLGREINADAPALSASLDDGSRIAMMIPPNSCGGVTMTIRKFRPQRFSLDELIQCGSVPQTVAHIIRDGIRSGKNVLISGGNGSGKTTTLNAFASACIPRDRRVICIEDNMREIHLDDHPNKVYWQASARYGIAPMAKEALRNRIQTIIIGEVVGEEGMALLNALATGHDGSFATIHANDARSALDKLAACAMQAGQGLTYQAVRLRIHQSIHYNVHMENRRVSSVSRVHGYDMDTDQFALDSVYSTQQ